jgi:hypothetical protein
VEDWLNDGGNAKYPDELSRSSAKCWDNSAMLLDPSRGAEKGRLVAAYVEQVYEYGNFALLGIGV